MDPATIRAIVTGGKGRMPAFPHLNDVDIENLVSYVAAPVPGGGEAAARPAPTFPARTGRGLRRCAAARRDRTRPRGRAPYPEGVEQQPQYVIDAYGTIGVRMKPPFTSLTKYTLNTGTIKWQVGLG